MILYIVQWFWAPIHTSPSKGASLDFTLPSVHSATITYTLAKTVQYSICQQYTGKTHIVRPPFCLRQRYSRRVSLQLSQQGIKARDSRHVTMATQNSSSVQYFTSKLQSQEDSIHSQVFLPTSTASPRLHTSVPTHTPVSPPTHQCPSLPTHQCPRPHSQWSLAELRWSLSVKLLPLDWCSCPSGTPGTHHTCTHTKRRRQACSGTRITCMQHLSHLQSHVVKESLVLLTTHQYGRLKLVPAHTGDAYHTQVHPTGQPQEQ